MEKIFEDDSLLLINKPFGVIVNTAETTKNEFTISDWMEKNYSPIFAGPRDLEFKKRHGVVHRLDKDTSGLLLLAKNEKSFTDLLRQFKSREVVKRYLALVHGKLSPADGTISLPIERNPFNRKRFGVFVSGREAETNYQLKSTYFFQNNYYSLVDVTPKTGRTHQIRVHLTHLGYPLVSDILYSGRKKLQSDLKFCPRMFLHAYFLSFIHPSTGQKKEFKIDLPEELQGVLERLTS